MDPIAMGKVDSDSYKKTLKLFVFYFPCDRTIAVLGICFIMGKMGYKFFILNNQT